MITKSELTSQYPSCGTWIHLQWFRTCKTTLKGRAVLSVTVSSRCNLGQAPQLRGVCLIPTIVRNFHLLFDIGSSTFPPDTGRRTEHDHSAGLWHETAQHHPQEGGSVPTSLTTRCRNPERGNIFLKCSSMILLKDLWLEASQKPLPK